MTATAVSLISLIRFPLEPNWFKVDGYFAVLWLAALSLTILKSPEF